MQKIKSAIADSVPFTVIGHSKTLAIEELLLFQREAVHLPWRRWTVEREDFWNMSRRRAQKGGKFACLDRQWHQSFKSTVCSV